MSSMIAYFHKHFVERGSKTAAVDTMKSTIKHIQQTAIPKDSKHCSTSDAAMQHCDKCGELRKKKDLQHIDEINEDFCTDCVNMMKLARDDY